MATNTTSRAAELASIEPEKPLLRGWLHLVMAPLVLAAGLVLAALAPTLTGRLSMVVYTLSAVTLFGMSAIYHRGDWPPRIKRVLRRFDHANIFVFIAGTYTPLTMTLLTGWSRWALLILIWSIAVFGMLFRILWLAAPRWLYTVLYVGMGWAAIGWLPQFWAAGGPAIVILILAGGVVYTLGAVSYATKRPKLNPTWFGFHEIFHAATIIAATLHLAAISLALFA